MKAIITEAYYTGNNFESHGKTLYVHAIKFEGESVIHHYNSVSKKQDKFVVGKECEFDVIPSSGNHPPKIKPVAQNSGFSKGGKQSDPKSFAASYAKDIAVACINMGIAKSTAQVDALIEHYYNNFLNRMQ